MSEVQPCLTAMGVCQPNIGDAQMLLTPAMHFPAHGHMLSGAPVRAMMEVMPFFKGFTPKDSTGFSLGCPGSDHVSFTIMFLLMSVIF